MKKPVAEENTTPAKGDEPEFVSLIAEVRKLVQSARHAAASTVNTLQVLTNFEIGH